MDLEHSMHYSLKLNTKFKDTCPEISCRVQLFPWIRDVFYIRQETEVLSINNKTVIRKDNAFKEDRSRQVTRAGNSIMRRGYNAYRKSCLKLPRTTLPKTNGNLKQHRQAWTLFVKIRGKWALGLPPTQQHKLEHPEKTAVRRIS
jgi:hypothetical protein